MSNENMNEGKNTDAARDESLPLTDLVSMIEAANNNVVNEKKNPSSGSDEVSTSEATGKTNLSPLEELKALKEKEGTGIKVTNEELEKGIAHAPSVDVVDRDERKDEWKAKLKELDDTINKRQAVVLIKKPVNPVEYAKMINEIDSLVFGEDGTPHFEFINSLTGESEDPEFVRLRKPGENSFDFDSLEVPENERPNNSSEEKTDETAQSENDDDEPELSDSDKKVVQVLIDKTGLGSEFIFNEEEKEKLAEADIIRVNEVKLIDIETIKAKKSEKSFQDVVSTYSTKGSKVWMTFPASGFRAQMCGMSIGEYSDVSLDMENVTFDQYYKRLSIIFNKMVNPTCGEFEDFNDFLHKFAYTDIPVALYGLWIATEQEVQEMPLRCGNEKCKKSFNWKYSTRGLIQFDRCSHKFINDMEKIIDSPASEYKKIAEEAAVNNSKFLKLEDSGFIIEMGVTSAYEFLYNFIPVMDEEKFTEAFGEDPNNTYLKNILLLPTVRTVRIPDGDEWIIADTYKDILDALYNITPGESKIIEAYAEKITGLYTVYFGLKNIKCPHCKTITKSLNVDIDSMVFQSYQTLQNTPIDLDSMQNS